MLAQSLTKELIDWIISRGDDKPIFCYSGDVIRSGVSKLKDELGAKISFATKANSHPLVLQELKDLVDEFNVTNLSDLDLLLNLDVEPQRISWIHPVIPSNTVKQVLSRGIRRFVIDDERGLNLLSAAANNLAITLRMRPADTGESQRSIVRFGNSKDILLSLATKVMNAGHHIEALSFFVGVAGTGMDEAHPFISGIDALAQLNTEFRDKGIVVPTINIGGGFPGSRRRFYLNNPEFFYYIRNKIENTFDSDITILCEPGRYLVEPCMLMASKVIVDRELAGRRMIYLQASAYGGLFEIAFIDSDDGLTIGTCAQGDSKPANLLGPIMDSFDVIKRNCQLPLLKEGDVLLLANVGAYAMGYSNQAEGIRTPDVIKIPDKFSLALSEIWYE
jgi:ornithine decarboxylase